MIRRKGLGISLLAFLILFIGCAPLSETRQIPGSLEDLPGCYVIFPAASWESVHKIEATIRGWGSFSLLGVTKGEPLERRLQSLLLTLEGFILFDAELSEEGLAVRKAVVPFDSPAFARGLMEDVSLLFLPPQVKPTAWGKETDGTMVCKWQGPGDFRTDIKESMDGGWRIEGGHCLSDSDPTFREFCIKEDESFGREQEALKPALRWFAFGDSKQRGRTSSSDGRLNPVHRLPGLSRENGIAAWEVIR